MKRSLSKPCPKKYEHPFWQGKHNVVGGHTIARNGEPGRYVPKRCVACGAKETS